MLILAVEENEQRREQAEQEYQKQVEEVRERNKERQEALQFTELWYTFVDPYATDVDDRGSDDAHKAVGVLVIKDGKRESHCYFHSVCF